MRNIKNVVKGCKTILSKISIITDSLIGPKLVRKRELKKRDQRDYTKK